MPGKYCSEPHRGVFTAEVCCLGQTERLRREAFAATLAHELRQPLSALLAAVEVLRLALGGIGDVIP